MSKHITRRLEARLNHQLGRLWAAVPIPGEFFCPSYLEEIYLK